MEWDDLKIFLAAVRAGSYTAAARHLGINRTTVGRRIEALEAQLGVELFHYYTNSPHPTAAGKSLLEAATQMEAAVQGVEEKLRDQSRFVPSIRIASSAGFASEFLPEFAEFQALHPHISIELLAEPDPVDSVTHRRADLGLAILRVPPKRLEGVELATLTQAQYGAKRRSHDRGIGWGHEMDHAIPAQWTSSNLSGPDAEAAGQPSFNNWPQLKEAVLAGLGTASLWCFAASQDERLEQLSPADPRHSYPLWMLRRATFAPSPALSTLMDFLQNRLTERLHAINLPK